MHPTQINTNSAPGYSGQYRCDACGMVRDDNAQPSFVSAASAAERMGQ
jgi:hypothetical protein